MVMGIVGVLVFYDFPARRSINEVIQSPYSVEDPQFARAMNELLGPQLIPGNRVQTLVNGDQIFPSMLGAIRGARKTIALETYIYWSGKVGKQFTDALCERAKAGVRVNLLLDWLGSKKIDMSFLDRLKACGVEVVRYHPVPWFTFTSASERTHRKILVVDGRIGFTGGVGIADHWIGNADTPEHWRDTHFRFEGPVVAQMQAAFIDHWMEITGKLLHGDDYFPPLQPAGNLIAQAFKSSPRDGSDSARLMYLLSIACARKSILMSNAYFVPDDLSIRTFIAAAQRGVKIKIIAPGKITDTKIVRQASRACWDQLMNAGIEFYEYQPTMFHCKVMVVDGIWSSVGSTNFDNRSFRLDDEANLNVLDRDFAHEQELIFQDDLKHSHRVTLAEWKKRPFTEKIQEQLAGLLRHQF